MNYQYLKILLFLLLFIPYPLFSEVNPHNRNLDKGMTANEIVEMIKKHVNCKWNDKTVDTFKAGNPNTQVTGIVCTFMATMDVLYMAVARNCNLIITHEPTFYNHLDETSQFNKDDQVIAAKKKYIEENGLVIWRFHDHIHAMNPDGIMEGIIKKLGWEVYKTNDPLIFQMPDITIKELAENLNNKFSKATVRIIGDPSLKIKNVAYAAGAPGYITHVSLLEKENVDVVVGGEVPEWESISYVRDASSLGMNKAMILLGHVNSEEAGMKYCSEWISGFIKDIPVLFIPAGDSFSAY